MATVFIRNFDEGVISTFGGVLRDVVVDGGQRREYVVPIAGIEGPPEYHGALPVYFVVGKGVFRPKRLPAIVIRRTELEPAFQNGGQSWGIESKTASPGAPTVTVTLPSGSAVTGPSRVMVKLPATPFNIAYDITARCRGPSAMADAALALAHLLSIATPPGFTVRVRDSDDGERGYDGFVQSIADIAEVADLLTRDAGWTVGFLIHGELDLSKPVEARTVIAIPVANLDTME